MGRTIKKIEAELAVARREQAAARIRASEITRRVADLEAERGALLSPFKVGDVVQVQRRRVGGAVTERYRIEQIIRWDDDFESATGMWVRIRNDGSDGMGGRFYSLDGVTLVKKGE